MFSAKMKFFAVVLGVALAAEMCLAQIFFKQQPIVYQLGNHHGIVPDIQQVAPPHRAVEINAAHEALLPPELLKSKKFYDDPRIAAGLAKASWMTNKEFAVHNRQAERIPREKIYKLAKDAGFIMRR